MNTNKLVDQELYSTLENVLGTDMKNLKSLIPKLKQIISQRMFSDIIPDDIIINNVQNNINEIISSTVSNDEPNLIILGKQRLYDMHVYVDSNSEDLYFYWKTKGKHVSPASNEDMIYFFQRLIDFIKNYKI